MLSNVLCILTSTHLTNSTPTAVLLNFFSCSDFNFCMQLLLLQSIQKVFSYFSPTFIEIWTQYVHPILAIGFCIYVILFEN